jgi:hypothetical protein
VGEGEEEREEREERKRRRKGVKGKNTIYREVPRTEKEYEEENRLLRCDNKDLQDKVRFLLSTSSLSLTNYRYIHSSKPKKPSLPVSSPPSTQLLLSCSTAFLSSQRITKFPSPLLRTLKSASRSGLTAHLSPSLSPPLPHPPSPPTLSPPTRTLSSHRFLDLTAPSSDPPNQNSSSPQGRPTPT